VAHAQWAVFDVGNFSQNILTAGRTLQTVENQVTQLQNEAQMLDQRGSKSTEPEFQLPVSDLEPLEHDESADQPSAGLPFNVSQMNTQFTRYYPQSYSLNTSVTQMAADAQTRWTYSRAALQTSMQLQAQAAQNAPSDQSTLEQSRGSKPVRRWSIAGHPSDQSIAGAGSTTVDAGAAAALDSRPCRGPGGGPIGGAEARAFVVRAQFIGNGTQYTPQP
jgi:hypothetical protein